MAEYVYTDKDGETLTIDEFKGCVYIDTFRAVMVPPADVPRIVAEICTAARMKPEDVLRAIEVAR